MYMEIFAVWFMRNLRLWEKPNTFRDSHRFSTNDFLSDFPPGKFCISHTQSTVDCLTRRQVFGTPPLRLSSTFSLSLV